MISKEMKELYEFINDEFVNKYDELEYCNIYPLSEQFIEEVEFIIKVKEDISDEDFGILNFLLKRDIAIKNTEVLGNKYSKPYIYVLSRY